MKGFTLLEVFIALSLFSVGVLFSLQQQLKCQNALNQINDRHIALEQCLSLIERLRVNTSLNNRRREINEWNQENKFLLPHGTGEISFDKGYKIRIYWNKGLKKNVFTYPV